MVIIALFALYNSAFAFFGTEKVKQYTINLSASSTANAIGKGPSAPINVSIYLLRDTQKFNKANYFALEERSTRTLRTDLDKKQQFLLLPNKAQTFSVDTSDDVRYIGVVAAYSSLKGKNWRRVIDLNQLKAKQVNIQVQRSGVNIVTPQPKKTVKSTSVNKFYITALASFGTSDFSSLEHRYNEYNTRLLIANKTTQTGPYGLGFGYQWNFAKSPGVNFFSSISAGIQINTVPELKAQGKDDNYRRERAVTKSVNDFEFTSNALQYLFIAKTDVISFNKFSIPFEVGVGSSQYKTEYITTKQSDGSSKKTDSSNNATIYQLGLGLDYRLTEALSVGMAYQYVSGGEIHLKEAPTYLDIIEHPSVKVSQQLLTLKLHYYF